MSHLLSDVKAHWRERRDLYARERALLDAVTPAQRNELEVIFSRGVGQENRAA